MQRTSVKIISSFSGLILAGTIILYYFGFENSTGSRNIINAFFLSISGVCVTGLSVINISQDLNFAGQAILLFLIQLGGMGVLTLSNWIAMSFKGKLKITQFDSTNKTLGTLSKLPAPVFLRKIITFTFTAEFIGAVILFFCFLPKYSFKKAIWMAVFHSISAFCNAGFSLFSDSFMVYQNHVLINLTLISLIISGGIGFLVITDLMEYAKSFFKKEKYRLSLQSKISLSVSLWLILAGVIFIFIFEYHNTLEGKSIFNGLLNSLFLSITSRTAGFNTISTGNLSTMTLVIVIFLMIVGASSGSTGGGVKTSTLSVIWALIRSVFKKRENLELYSRTISKQDVTRAIGIWFLYSLALIAAFIALQFLEVNGHAPIEAKELFLDHFFEVVSALGTVGLSTGITPGLTTGGKIVLMICMFTGRVGLLVLISSLIGKQRKISYSYPEEYLMVG